MKKFFKYLFLSGLIFFTVFWSFSILKCEYLTFVHKDEFAHFEEIEGSTKFRILEYKDDYAELYSIHYIGPFGHTHIVRKENGEWSDFGWAECVWSSHGSADGYMWPYGR